MFTGIVEESGVIESIRKGEKAIQLQVKTRICGGGLKIGDSIAVNGCCLTVVGKTRRGKDTVIQLDLLRETWNRTNLHALDKGSRVNLERALSAHGRMDGHFVTGHIDGTGRIQRWQKSGDDWVLDVEAPADIMRYVIFKGSIAVDGISLTIAKVWKKKFRIWIIPHTYEVTALQERHVGDLVNLEADLLGKYVEKMIGNLRFNRK